MATMMSAQNGTMSSRSTTYLTELRHAHGKLLQAMGDLDKITRGPVPPKQGIVEARWNISRASLTRRLLWHRIDKYLSNPLLGYEPTLAQLRQTDQNLLRASSEHVGRWTIDRILSDWPAYCQASHAIRWKMKAAIEGETRLLYPLLENALPSSVNSR